MKKIIITILSILMITSCVLTLGACSCGKNKKPSHTTHEYGAWKFDNDKHWKECSCGEKSELANHDTVADDGDCATAVVCSCGYVLTPAKASHSGGTATCTAKAECENCGKQYGELNPANHSSNEFTYVDNNDGTHTKKNKCCGAVVVANEAHTHTEETPCVCGAIKAHVHNHATTWSRDNDYHWRECACGDKADKAGHEWGTGEVTTAPQVGVDGVRTFTCSVCEKTKTEPIAALVQLNHVAETYEIDLDSVVFDWKGNDLDEFKMTFTNDQAAIENQLKNNNFAANEYFIILSDAQVEHSGKGIFVYDVDANGKINLYTSLENYTNKIAVSDFSAQFNPVRDQITFSISFGVGGSTISATYNMIDKASVMLAVPNTSFEYDGMEKVLIEIDEESPYKIFAGSVKETNVGNYEVTIELKDKKNAKWSDGTLLPKTFAWEITKTQGSIAFNDGVDLTKTYDGIMMNNIEEHQYIKTGDGNVEIEWYKGENKLESAPVDAGDYNVKLILEETTNYTGATAEKTFTINKKRININITKPYDGNDDLTVGVISYPMSNYKILEMDESFVNVSIVSGSKYSTADVHDNESLSSANVIALSGEKANNYRAYIIKGYIVKGESNIAFNPTYVAIKKYDGNPASDPTAEDYTFNGNGTVTVTWYNAYIDDFDDQQTLEREGAPTDITNHHYFVEISVAETENYKASSAHIEFEIVKGDSNIVFTNALIPLKAYDGNAPTITTDHYSKNGDGAVTFEWYSFGGGEEPLGTAPTAVGSYTLKAIVAGTSNYNASEESILYMIVNPDNAFEITNYSAAGSVTGTIGKGRIQFNDKMILVVDGVSVQMVTVTGITKVSSQEQPWYIEYPVGDSIVLTLDGFYDSVLESYTSAILFSMNSMNS